MSSADATAENVLQGIRAWLKLAGAAEGLTDAQVIPADDKGLRPALPYLTVKLTAADVPVGEDAPVEWLGDQVTVEAADPDDVYTLTVNGEEVSYTRTEDDTEATVATALAAAVNAALPLVYAEASDDVLWLASLNGTLETEVADARLTLLAAELPVVGIMGVRSAVASVQAWGSGARPWLERATLRLRMPDVLEALEEAGLSITPTGGMTDVAALLDTAIEPRRLREFDVLYGIRTDPALRTPLGTVTTAATLSKFDGDTDPYTVTITAEIP